MTKLDWEHSPGSEMADAVERLRKNGVFVQARAYGFYVAVLVVDGCIAGECGVSSASNDVEISLRIPGKGVYLIKRQTVEEIVDIVTTLFNAAKREGLTAVVDSASAFEDCLIR